MYHDNTHLTLEERKVIQVGIEHGSTKKTAYDTNSPIADVDP